MRARFRFRLTHVICVLWVSKCPSSLSLSGWLEQIDTNSEIGTPSYNFNLVWFWSKGRTGCCQRQCFVFSPCAAGCVACGQNMSQTTTTRSKTEGELVFRSSERRWHKSIASCWLNWKSTRWYQPAQSSGNLTIRVCACICGTTFLPESDRDQDQDKRRKSAGTNFRMKPHALEWKDASFCCLDAKFVFDFTMFPGEEFGNFEFTGL